ncbi:MAG: DUF3291 domain-containing protein [Xanthobacteraceae bacterium]
MPLVSITRLRVRSLRFLPAFLLGSLRSARAAKKASGNLAVSLLSDAHLAFWTRTLWTDEHSMRAFMLAPAHRAVMPKLLQWCDEAAVTHWLQELPEPPEPPSWQEVYRRLQQEGRTSRVDYPSEAQLRFEIPPPKTTRQLTLKSPPRARGTTAGP